MVFALASGHAGAEISLPVVRTWGDLENAPKFTVIPSPWVQEGETPPKLPPVTFQVGIQSNKATSYGGLVLYFLESKGSGALGTPQERGLYFWEVVNDQVKTKAQTANLSDGPKGDAGAVFYAESIPFGAAGDYVVKLVRPFNRPGVPDKPVILAQLKVHVLDHPEDLWFPFWTTSGASGGAPSGQNADGTRYATVSVNNSMGGAAIPKPPEPRSYVQLPATDQRLPVLVPDGSDESHVHLQMLDSALIVKFDPQIEAFFPDDFFLTRWWVNGKQIDLDPALDRPPQARRALGVQESEPVMKRVVWRQAKEMPLLMFGALVWYTNEVHFDLQFLPEWLGVKKGDQVSVQLLFCPNGFKDTGLQNAQLNQAQALDETEIRPAPECFSAMSNRVDFIYSGNPVHPQK